MCESKGLVIQWSSNQGIKQSSISDLVIKGTSDQVFAILGSTMSVNVATQKSDHGCYHYLLIYAIKPNLWKYLLNMNEFN